MSIAVVIPTYNRSARVAALARSIIPQLLDEDELIVSDDNSPDDTIDQLSNLPKVQVHRHGESLGMVGNWNACIALATKRWVCMIHDDDQIDPGALQTIRNIIAAVGHSPCVIAGGSLNKPGQTDLRFRYVSPGKYAVLNAPQIPSGTVIHRAVFDAQGVYDPQLKFSPDLEFFPRLARQFPLVLIDSPAVVVYQVHDSNHQYNTWRDPQFVNQLERIVRRVGEYAGFTGQELDHYFNVHMTGFLRYMLQLSRTRGGHETVPAVEQNDSRQRRPGQTRVAHGKNGDDPWLVPRMAGEALKQAGHQ